MACGRNIIVFCLPFLMTFASLALTIIVLISNTKEGSPIQNLYFLKMDVTGITAKAFTGLNSIVVAPTSSLHSTLKKYGQPDFYTSGLWGYCEGDYDHNNPAQMDFLRCSHPQAGYFFDAPKMLQHSLASNTIKVALPSNFTSNAVAVKTLSKLAYGSYMASAVVIGLAFICGFFAFHSRMASCCAALISFIAFITSFIASAATTALYIGIRTHINRSTHVYGIKVTLNNTMLIITWVATAMALSATLWWVLTICCGSTRKTREPEKEPFIPAASYPGPDQYQGPDHYNGPTQYNPPNQYPGPHQY